MLPPSTSFPGTGAGVGTTNVDRVAAAPADPAGEVGARELRQLLAEVRAGGLLDRRPLYYSLEIASTVAMWVGGWVALVLLGDTWAALGIAAFLAVSSTRVVFIGHDAGHQQVFGSHRSNRLLGLAVGDLLTGLSFGWWVPKHNAHHANPNQVGRDPDIAVGVVAWTPEIARGRRGLAGFLVRHQAWTFFPLLLLLAVSMHHKSVRSVITQRTRAAFVEAVLLAVHFGAYLAVVLWVLSPLRAVAFVAVQQGLFGLYLGCAFAPNHKGMPIYSSGREPGFIRRQVTTARNVSGGRLTTWVLGGLDHQIEHHLFPTLPRPNLTLAEPIVRSFCAAHDLDYCEESLIGSYRRALAHLREVGRADSFETAPELDSGELARSASRR